MCARLIEKPVAGILGGNLARLYQSLLASMVHLSDHQTDPSLWAVYAGCIRSHQVCAELGDEFIEMEVVQGFTQFVKVIIRIAARHFNGFRTGLLTLIPYSI